MLLLVNGCTKNTIPVTVIPNDENKPTLTDSKTQIGELEAYEIVNCSDYPHIEISGEKMTFLGESYEEFSSALYEKLMAKAVRFYMEAYIDDFEYLEAYAGIELMDEIEKAISDVKGTSYIYGGNQVVTLKELIKYNKPYYIKAPTKVDENKYLVEMYDLDKSNVINVTISGNSPNEIKVFSFYVKKIK
jgi:hypothetical protein